MYVICGLGNPGREYEATRHNMGFTTIDLLADRLGVQVKQLKFKALIGEARIGSEKVLLVKPQTYMNLSGEALRPIMDYYKVEPSHLMVIYDDADLAVGAVRIRPSGSSGSHNGMKSVIYQLQTDKFPRIRIGIGDKGVIPMDRFVLGHWTEEERPLFAEAVSNAADACVMYVEQGLDKAMNRFNVKKSDGEKKKTSKKEEPQETENKADGNSSPQ